METEKNFLYVMSAVCVGLWGYAAALLWLNNKENPQEDDINTEQAQAENVTEPQHYETYETTQEFSVNEEEPNVESAIIVQEVPTPTKKQRRNMIKTPKFAHKKRKASQSKVKTRQVKNKEREKAFLASQYSHSFQTWLEDHGG